MSVGLPKGHDLLELNRLDFGLFSYPRGSKGYDMAGHCIVAGRELGALDRARHMIKQLKEFCWNFAGPDR